MKSLKMKSHMKNYYSSQSLNDDKIQQLAVLTGNGKEEVLSNDFGKQNNYARLSAILFERRVGLVASLLFVMVSFWGFTNYEQNKFLRNNFTQVVAQEIALNHRKQLSLDFKAVAYEKLATLMVKLDFQIKNSDNVNLRGLNVVGARYCSIQGNIAAQVRLRDDEGQIYTLYQTKLTDRLKKSPANIQTVDQVEVKQWRENNLFFGLAATLPPPSL